MSGETAPVRIPTDSIMTHLHFAELHIVDIGPKRGVSARIAFGTEYGDTIGMTTLMSGPRDVGGSIISDRTFELLRQVKASLLLDAASAMSPSGQVGAHELDPEELDPEDEHGEGSFDLGG